MHVCKDNIKCLWMIAPAQRYDMVADLRAFDSEGSLANKSVGTHACVVHIILLQEKLLLKQ